MYDSIAETLAPHVGPLIAAFTKHAQKQQAPGINIPKAFGQGNGAISAAFQAAGQQAPPTQKPMPTLPQIQAQHVDNSPESHNMGKIDPTKTPIDPFDAATQQINAQYDPQIAAAHATQVQTQATETADIEKLKGMHGPTYAPPQREGIVHNTGSRNTALGLGLLGLLVPGLRQGIGQFGQSAITAHNTGQDQKQQDYKDKFGADEKEFTNQAGMLEKGVNAESVMDRLNAGQEGTLQTAKAKGLAQVMQARKDAAHQASVMDRFSQRLGFNERTRATLNDLTNRRLDMQASSLALRGEDVHSLIETRQARTRMQAAGLQIRQQLAQYRLSGKGGSTSAYKDAFRANSMFESYMSKANGAIAKQEAILANPNSVLTPEARQAIMQATQREVNGYYSAAQSIPELKKYVTNADQVWSDVYGTEENTAGVVAADPNAKRGSTPPTPTNDPVFDATKAKIGHTVDKLPDGAKYIGVNPKTGKKQYKVGTAVIEEQ